MASAKHTGKATNLEFEYNWYLYRNGQRVEQIITDTSDEIQLEISEPGTYQIGVYVRFPGGSNIINFFSVDFEVSK